MKKSRAGTVIAVAFLILSITLAVSFGAGAPGSEDDPVVTKSYVDEVSEKLWDKVEKAIEDDKKENEAQGTQQKAASWEVVCVPGGKRVIGETGTQMILRSGSATAIDNGANGISDLTGGKDLRMGTAISKDHLLLIPGSDGRGMKTLGECWLMIQGGYALQ